MSEVFAPMQDSEAGPQPSRIRTILLGKNPQHHVLVWRNAMGFIPCGVSALLIILAMYRGLCEAGHGWLLCSGMLATFGAFHIALRSGWSQQFHDPSLSLASVLAAMGWSVLVYMFAGAIHATQLLFLGLLMGLGVFTLNARHMRLVCVFGVVTMGAAIVTMTQIAPLQYPPLVGYFYLAMLVICMPTMLAVGMQRIKLTHKLNRQKAELADALTRLKEIAIRDALTGLYNRGHMVELLQHAVARQERTGETFSFVMFDLDYFKRVNDTHGHAVGDDVLRSFAHVATAMLRKSDVLARWGGEEFVAICPHSDDPHAVIGVERLLREWSETEVSSQAPQLRVSFSAGITTYRKGEAIDSALGRADEALYRAKAKGRNCIVRS